MTGTKQKKFREKWYSPLVQNCLSQKRAQKYSEICFSKQVWKGANPEVNLVFFKQPFLNKSVEGGKY